MAIGGWFKIADKLARAIGPIFNWLARQSERFLNWLKGLPGRILEAIKSGGRWAKNTAKDAWNWLRGNDGFSRTPQTLQDEMALEAAKRGAGNKIIDNLGDKAFKGMEKWEYKVKSAGGADSVVHYVRNPRTGELLDFKFTKHSNGVIP